MARHVQAPGFFGKLPSHGDFVGRRLPPGVRHCLDEWLQRALAQSRTDLGPAWLSTWGSSPIWRFVIGAGVCGEEAWAGVMMPSADRVGRCFPLLLAAPVEVAPSLDDCLVVCDRWFAQLETLALSALDEEFSLEQFDLALTAVENMPRTDAVSRPQGPLRLPGTPASVVTLGSAVSLQQTLDGQSAWWTEGSPRIEASLATAPGLPAPTAFASLLDGKWMERGWRSLPPSRTSRRPPFAAG